MRFQSTQAHLHSLSLPQKRIKLYVLSYCIALSSYFCSRRVVSGSPEFGLMKVLHIYSTAWHFCGLVEFWMAVEKKLASLVAPFALLFLYFF